MEKTTNSKNDREQAIEHATRLGWFDPEKAVARLEASRLDTSLLRAVVEWEATGNFPGAEGR